MSNNRLPISAETIFSHLTQAPLIIFGLDRSGKITFTNGKGLAFLGQTPGQVVGQSVFELYRSLPEALAKVKQVLETGETMEIGSLIGDKWFKSIIIPYKAASGEVAGAFGLAINITEEVKARKEAAEIRKLYESLFQTVPLGLGIADLNGNLLFYNDEIMRPGGYTREDIKAMVNVTRLYYDPTERDQALALARKQGFLDRLEVRFRKKSGGFYYAQMSLRPIEYLGKPAWLAAVDDITAKKQVDQEQRRRNLELENLNRLLVGREVKMAELKKQIETLRKQAANG